MKNVALTPKLSFFFLTLFLSRLWVFFLRNDGLQSKIFVVSNSRTFEALLTFSIGVFHVSNHNELVVEGTAFKTL